LDVRIGEFGNFGKNMTEAKANAEMFINVAKNIGIEAVCFLNDFQSIQQPYIGRSEALIALNNIFNLDMCELLKSHLYRCMDMALALSDKKPTFKKGISFIKENFQENLESQNTSMQEFYNKVQWSMEQHVYKIYAEESGFLHIDLNKLRLALTWGQSMYLQNSRFPDNCGVILKKNPNEFVFSGELILTYRAMGIDIAKFKNLLTKSISLQTEYQESCSYKKVKNG